MPLLGSELIGLTHFDSPREGDSGARVQTPLVSTLLNPSPPYAVAAIASGFATFGGVCKINKKHFKTPSGKNPEGEVRITFLLWGAQMV